MKNPTTIACIIGLIFFTWLNAQLAESVSTYQLNAAYQCSIQGAVCTGQFGSIKIISE